MAKKYNNSFQVGLAPKNGDPGEAGPTYYPAGIYDPNTQYIRTKATVPFVLSPGNKKYYVLEKFGITQGVNPETDTSGVWGEFDYIKYAFFEIFMANFGKIASAVFSGDVMMSQYGIDGTNNYQNYTDENGVWQPNIYFNFLTGAGHLAGGNIKWDSEGESVFIGSIQSTKDGNRIEINAGERKFTMTNSGDQKVFNLSFTSDGAGSSYAYMQMDMYIDGYRRTYSNYSPFWIEFNSYSGTTPQRGSLSSSTFCIIQGYEGTSSERRIEIDMWDSGEEFLEMRMRNAVISNLSLKNRKVLGSSSVWLENWDVYVNCYNSANINCYLPPTPSPGAIKFIRRMNTSNVTVMGNGNQIAHGNGSVSNSISVGGGRGDTAVLYWDGQYWSYNYMVRDA